MYLLAYASITIREFIVNRIVFIVDIPVNNPPSRQLTGGDFPIIEISPATSGFLMLPAGRGFINYCCFI